MITNLYHHPYGHVGRLNGISELLIDLVRAYGYFGIFFVSVLGSLIPFLPLPYLIIVVLMSRVLNPLELGIIAGIGGALGKTTSYLLGRSGYNIIGKRTKKNLDLLRGLIGKYGDLGVFIFAVTPLPDDVYMIPIGMVRFPFWRFLIANIAGKIVLSVAVAYFGRGYFNLVRVYLGEGALESSILAVTFTILITILFVKINWERVIEIMQKKGVKGLISNLTYIFTSDKES